MDKNPPALAPYRPRYALADLLAECGPAGYPRDLQEWEAMQDVGLECREATPPETPAPR